MCSLLRTHSLAGSLLGITQMIDDVTEMQFPCVALDLPSRIVFVHSYMYCNLLKHKLMSIVDRPSDRPQLERHCCSQ